jgi:hypothetical protein
VMWLMLSTDFWCHLCQWWWYTVDLFYRSVKCCFVLDNKPPSSTCWCGVLFSWMGSSRSIWWHFINEEHSTWCFICNGRHSFVLISLFTFWCHVIQHLIMHTFIAIFLWAFSTVLQSENQQHWVRVRGRPVLSLYYENVWRHSIFFSLRFVFGWCVHVCTDSMWKIILMKLIDSLQIPTLSFNYAISPRIITTTARCLLKLINNNNNNNNNNNTQHCQLTLYCMTCFFQRFETFSSHTITLRFRIISLSIVLCLVFCVVLLFPVKFICDLLLYLIVLVWTIFSHTCPTRSTCWNPRSSLLPLVISSLLHTHTHTPTPTHIHTQQRHTSQYLYWVVTNNKREW